MLNPDLPRPFGPYSLIRRLAVGGMAEVYLASAKGSVGFEKLVALKRIHPHLSSDQGFVSMLIDEAKLSVSLNHHNIVQTFDLGCIEDSHFIVMEHVEGYDLDQVLRALRERRERLPVGVAAHMIVELCRGLAYAHKQVDAEGRLLGIVHRDVSPQNILVSFAGEVKIADFGIAKTALQRAEAEAGVIKGKYFYMSPEQAWGDPVDYRSDIFSAGVVFWELLVGESLHQTKPVLALLDDVRRAEVPPPSSQRPEVPVALDAIVARATAADPSDRFDDAASFADAICEVLAASPPVHPEVQLRTLLAELEPPPRPEPSRDEVPRTRDRVVTRHAVQQVTPSSAQIRFSLDDGEPTVAGWRSPRVPEQTPWLWLAFGVASLLGAFGVWWLGQ